MNLVKKIEQYNNDYLVFCEPIKNNVMDEGHFIRILYSSDCMILNGIYLFVHLTDISCEKYYNKYKCNFHAINNKQTTDSLKIIEQQILEKYKTDKTPSYKINEQLKTGHIKMFSESANNYLGNFILKISGIWETQTNYGLTYKFIAVNK